MDIIFLENERIKLLQELETWKSNYRKINYLYNFFEKVLSLNNSNISKAFLTEFLDVYINILRNTNPYYVEPRSIEKIIKQITVIKDLNICEEYDVDLKNSLNIYYDKFKILIDVLEGNPPNILSPKYLFPILEKEENGYSKFGFLESITTSINKHNEANKFIVIPSSTKLDNKLDEQIQTSWEAATKFTKKYVNKIFKFHEIIIQFDNKAGAYTGDSFGIALTISFIDQILTYYNSDYLIKIKPGITFTGGIETNQNVKSVSGNIIEIKTESVFYSQQSIFVVPKDDEDTAKIRILELKNKYPKRNLSIIAVENLQDIFDRRNIIEIKKQNYVVKTAMKIKTNWQSALLIGLLAIILGFYFYRDWDENPAILENIGNTVIVKNKIGRELWQTQIGYNEKNILNSIYLSQFQKIVDINEDGTNEIVFANENPVSLIKSYYPKIRCYDQNRKEIWNYSFKDTISTFSGIMDTIYAVNLIDTLTTNNMKTLFCIAKNTKSFSSAIFQLDLMTGKRINSTLWHSGFFTNGLISDFDNDNKKEIIATFINNGFEQIGILQIKIDKLNGQCPTTEKYKYRNLPIAELEQYILFPKTDFTHYLNRRIEAIPQGRMNFLENKKQIYISVELDQNNSQLAYLYDYKKNEFEIIIGNDFRAKRDSLVIKGELKQPLTDTEEYCNQIISRIKYWNGKEFIYK